MSIHATIRARRMNIHGQTPIHLRLASGFVYMRVPTSFLKGGYIQALRRGCFKRSAGVKRHLQPCCMLGFGGLSALPPRHADKRTHFEQLTNYKFCQPSPNIFILNIFHWRNRWRHPWCSSLWQPLRLVGFLFHFIAQDLIPGLRWGFPPSSGHPPAGPWNDQEMRTPGGF